MSQRLEEMLQQTNLCNFPYLPNTEGKHILPNSPMRNKIIIKLTKSMSIDENNQAFKHSTDIKARPQHNHFM